MAYPFNITDGGVSLFIEGKPHSFHKTHSSYQAIVNAIHAGDWDEVRALSDVKGNVARITQGRVKIFDTEIMVDGRSVTGKLIDRILEMVRLGSDAVDGYIAFLDNLMDNPRESAVNELYEFIEACDLPITPDGCFLAYKYVNDDWKDAHSRSVFHKPADLMSEDELDAYSEGVIGGARNEVTTKVVDGVTTVSMPRNMVDDVRTNTCSRGLHFCSISYLPSYGNGRHILVVKLNPAHVVSIPEEYSLNKGRTEAYQVVGTINHEEAQLTPWYTDEYEAEDDDLDFDPETGEIYDDEVDDLDDELFDDVSEDMFPLDDGGEPIPTPAPIDTSEADYSQKLSWEDVRMIRELFDEDELTLTQIAEEFGISRRQAARIRDGEVWKEDNDS